MDESIKMRLDELREAIKDNLVIDDCEFEFKCPQLWEELERTEEPDRRYCAVCKQDVFAARDPDTLDRLRSERRCVAVFQRFPDELLKGVMTPGLLFPPGMRRPVENMGAEEGMDDRPAL